MNLRLEFYQEDNNKITSSEKYIIENYIDKYDDSNYEKKFGQDVNENELKYLSSQGQNLLNWYPFNRKHNILQINGNFGELTGVFCDKCNKVTVIEENLIKAKSMARRFTKKENLEVIVGNLENIKLEEKYDMIALIGISPEMKLEETIKKVEKYLSFNGKIIIAVDNKFGLKFFAGNPENLLNEKFKSLIGYSDEKEKIETYTKSKLEAIFEKLGYNSRFYYPLPDYRLPNVIFSDESLPEYNSIDKYNPYYTQKSDILFNEIDVFREMLKTDKYIFTFFANSFLVEITKGECDKTYKYISFNNLRKEEYRIITKISDEYVEKQTVNERAEKHYQSIKNNMKILQDGGRQLVDYIDDGKIRSKYIEQKYLLNSILTEKLEHGENEEFYEILDNYIKEISLNTYKEKEYNNTIFGKYGIKIEDKEIIKNLNFMKNGLWDMTLKNCFLVDNKFLFFDQEWNEPNLPVEFILYRSIFYTISLRRFIDIDKLFEKYNLVPYLELFKILDNELQEKIRDDKVWEFYSQNHKFNIDETKQEIINLNIRSAAQEGANENLRKDNEELKKINNELQERVQNQKNGIKAILNNKLFKKMKRKLKKIITNRRDEFI